MNPYCYFNGEYLNLDQIKISPYDVGVLRGYGVFDVMTTQNKKAFLLDEHWTRLKNSAKTLNLEIPLSLDEYKKTISTLLEKNNFSKSNIRTILTGGISCNAFVPEKKKETFYILVEEAQNLPEKFYTNGAKVITINYKRNLPHAKITNYIMAIKHQKEKEENDALEIIYTKNNQALEATTSNFFIVRNNKIITSHKNILHGMTRNLVLKLAKENNIKTEEREIKTEELLKADEVFLTASNKNIVPIVKINQVQIGNGQPGDITKKLMNIFSKFVKGY